MKTHLKHYTVMALLLFFCLEGCMVWPIMTETNGYRPVEMGKEDQVFYPDAPRPIDLSSNFGHSQRLAVTNQILHPEASENLDTIEGLDGSAGAKGITRYRNFYKKPPFGGKKGSKK